MGQGKYAKEEGGGSVFVLLVILVLIVGIVAAAGLVMAVLNYNRESNTPVQVNVEDWHWREDNSKGYSKEGYYPNDGQSVLVHNAGAHRIDPHWDDSVWTIHANNNDNRLIYVDKLTRQHRGHFIDIINAVCNIAGKNCEIIHSDWRHCWWDNYPQAAILGKWLDGCMGWSITVERIRSFKYTTPTIRPARPVMMTRRGNPNNVNPDDLSVLKIGTLKDWWADAHCMFVLTGYEVVEEPIPQITQYNQDYKFETLLNGLNSGEVDVLFLSNELGIVTDGGMELLREYEPCILGGDSMVMRRDSYLKNWWDPAYEKLVKSREYREICEDIDDPEVHGWKPGSSAAETCFNY